MGIMEWGGLRRVGSVFPTAILLMGIVGVRQSEGSVIRPVIGQRPVYYATSGTIGSSGSGSIDSLGFQGVGIPSGASAPAGVFYMPGTFSLGAFQSRSLPPGSQQVFENKPYEITLDLFGGPSAGGVVSRIRIDGRLDGILSNEPGSGLLASVRSVKQVGTPLGTPPFRLADLRILAPQFILPAGSLPASSTPIVGYVSAQVPEPTSLATLGLGVSALLFQRARSRRVRSRIEIMA